MKFPKVLLAVPVAGLLLFGMWLHDISTPRPLPKNAVYAGNKVIMLPKNVKVELGAKPHQAKKVSLLDELINELGPVDANATNFPANGATYTATPGANINLQLASPQASAAYVACNMAISPVCRIFVNATISTLAVYNGVDGVDYTIEIVQDGSGHTVAVPTAGGTPAGIATQVAGWAVAQAPIAAAVTAPTFQAGSIVTWKMFYDSTNGTFIVYSIN